MGGFIPHPRVWFEGLESSRQQALTQIVLEHKGSVANSAGEATHFVFPDTSLEQVEEQKYFRVVERYGDKALLHWWYFPDSYDVWTPATQEHETQAVVTQKPWRVTSRWITDTDKFNEWMNENDYLYDEVRFSHSLVFELIFLFRLSKRPLGNLGSDTSQIWD